MQLIINITEHEKSVIDRYVDGHGYSYKDLTRTTVIESLAQAVHKGIPLPKGHGDLIDRNEVCRLDEELCATECGCCGLDGCFYDRAQAIIKADRSEEK